MNVFRRQTRVMRAAMLVALLTGASGVAMAQKPVGPPVLKPVGPPVDTKGTVQSNPKADKGQATAAAARERARERKETQSAFKGARHEAKSLHKGIKFTRNEARAYRAVEKKYDLELRALERSSRNAQKEGEFDPMLLARINAARMNQRSLLRAELSPAQRIRFDFNVTTLDGSK